jgi:hypothetical protein
MKTLKTGDEVILLYVVLPREDWEKVKLPQGCHAKAFETGPIERMVDVQTCKGWGAMMAASINRLAKKISPEIANSLIVAPPPTLDT